MLKLLVLLVVLCSADAMIDTGSYIGLGSWQVKNIKKCAEDSHKFNFDVTQKKVNRTHDAFYGKIKLQEALTEAYGVRIDICKHVDGGCKPYQVLADECFKSFVNKYAENNVRSCFEGAGIDPPEFPIEQGEYELHDYLFDYSEMPEKSVYGSYCAKCYILENTEEVGCIEAHVEFKENEDNCDDYEEK